MTKYYVVGDVHGDVSFASKVMKAANANGVHHIFQVGDFGVWDHHPDGLYFLDKVNENAELRDVYWWVVLGNHENYDSIERYQAESQGSMIHLRDRIRVLGNKSGMVELDGLKIAACGGAYSIDKARRTPGSSWWPQEMTTYGDVERLRNLVDIHGQPDILLTHDAPSSLPGWPGFMKDDPASNANRQMMDAVWDITRPKYWFHGHYHRALQYGHEGTFVVGLDMNGNGNSVVALNNDDGDVSWEYDNDWIYS
jgi:predicted phosphodiesterase